MNDKEYNQYKKLKNKIKFVDKGVQTERVIHIYNFYNEDSTEEDYQSSEETELNSEDRKLEEDLEKEDMSEEEDEKNYDNKKIEKKKKRKRSYMEYDDDELYYFEKLSEQEQDIINELEQEIAILNDEQTPMRFKILNSEMDLYLKTIAINTLTRMYSMHQHSSEYGKLMNWLDNLTRLPYGKYKEIKHDKESVEKYLNDLRENLDKDVYAHEDAKHHIVKVVAKWLGNKDSKGMILGIEGCMGTGKTTLCKSICKNLDIPFGFIPLGGISDGSYLVGHSYTYEGSKCGRIAEILMQCGVMNPVLYFDELDKISTTRYGDEIMNMLIHMTDPNQNTKFHDKYFSEIPLDLSKCLIIFSYNDGSLLNPILKDRITTIKIKDFTNKEKAKIIKDHVFPEIKKEYKADDIELTDEISLYVVSKSGEEHGVRECKKILESVVSEINLQKLIGKEVSNKITEEQIDKAHKNKDDLDIYKKTMMYS